ncbi:MAG: TonB family protein [Halothiobacillaceae bacterium]
MKKARKRGAALAWGVSLAVHGVLLVALLWWMDTVLDAPKPQATPVPLQLSMLVESVSKPVEPPAEPVLEPSPQVEPEPVPEPVVEPLPLTPEPVPEPVPVVKPKPPKPEPKVKTENKPKPKLENKPESKRESEPTPAQSAPSVVETQAVSQPEAQPVAAPVLAAPVLENAAALADAEADYKARVRSKVDAHKHYPKMARRNGEEGKVVVEFSLDASGAVSNVQIKQSSGSERLDEAAVQAVRDAAPFPPFPDEVKRNRWQFTLPLSFSLDS